jgi:hypothetical protein
MDPYLEQFWRDVHASLVLYARDQLQPQLGGPLRARVEERIVVELPSATADREIYPDVRVLERPAKSGAARAPHAPSGVVVADPLIIERLAETHTEGFIQVIDPAQGSRVVTVIEVLSPTNKRRGKAQDDYRRKQDELWEGGVNLVEVDLLRAGQRVLMVGEHEVPQPDRAAYAACVHRGGDAHRFEYYAIRLRERLPAIRVPLRPGDTDAVLDLQALIQQAYANGAYDDLDYAADPMPPLPAEDAAWADELLRKAGKR